jgi:glycosyltransferase involved in cell wall biosynthesis
MDTPKSALTDPNKIKVGFDRQTFAVQSFGGISRYFYDLFCQLLEEGSIEPSYLFRLHSNHYLDAKTAIKVESALLWRLIRKRHALCQSRKSYLESVDIVHATYSLGEPYVLKKSLLVSTLYDMIPERLPEYFPKGNPHAKKLMWCAASDTIISISQSSADDLSVTNPNISSRIRVIPLGTKIHHIKAQKPLQLDIQDSYVLFVGNRGTYKNSRLLLFALSRLRNAPDIVFAGGGSFKQHELQCIADLRLKSKVRQLSVSDQELAWLYKNALAVLVPSMAEGFSLPLIESLACDTPVFCSDIPVHREVGAKFAHFVRALDDRHWAEAIEQAASTPRPSQVQSEYAYKQLVEYFSPKRVAEDHVKVYRELI